MSKNGAGKDEERDSNITSSSVNGTAKSDKIARVINSKPVLQVYEAEWKMFIGSLRGVYGSSLPVATVICVTLFGSFGPMFDPIAYGVWSNMMRSHGWI